MSAVAITTITTRLFISILSEIGYREEIFRLQNIGALPVSRHHKYRHSHDMGCTPTL